MEKLKYHLARKSVKLFNACKMDERKQHSELEAHFVMLQ
jgi:hypothetical protein